MKTWNIAQKSVFKYDEYSHWIDYLSYWLKNLSDIEVFFTDRIFNLDTDNSNFWIVKFYDELFSIHKYKSPNWVSYQFSCTYESVSIPIFVITEYSEEQKEFCNNSYWIIHFYGAYFRLIELNHFSDWLIWSMNQLFLDNPISRLDYRFDFCSYEEQKWFPTIKDVFPNIRKNKKVNIHWQTDNVESWDIWQKKNKTVFIRLYNKLKELWWNIKKTYLYSDIDKFKTFTRLEYEFWNKWCSWYTWKDIELLIQKAFKTSWIEPSDFKWNLYKPQLALDLSDKIDKLRYIKIFTSMAKNLKNNGLDPISIIKKQWL
jgi:hypothetical protein